MSDWTTTGALALALGCVVVLDIGRRALVSQTSHALPPGPPGLPWVGNFFGIDATAPWKTYAKWARTYGDIVYTRLFGMEIIVINSEKIAQDLLANRSTNYSDRPCLGVSIEKCGLDFTSVRSRYGDRWRLHRRFFHQTFRPDGVPRFLPLQHRKGCDLLRRLFDAPEHLHDYVFDYTTSIILNSTYDYDPAAQNDELVDLLAKMLDISNFASRTDIAITTSAFPICKSITFFIICWINETNLFGVLHLPSWLPGASFKRKMALARGYSRQYLERLFHHSLQKVPSGSVEPSMVHDALRHLEEKGISPEESWMEILKHASGTAFLAASETVRDSVSIVTIITDHSKQSHAVLMTFFLMMVVNPAAQEKAQAQIDAVVGNARLPTLDDRPLLPFLDAIFWETIRYNPVVPLSVPHAAVDNDVYDGFHIPKGALVITNLWSMAHDESKYPNADAFIPERYLNDDGSLKPNDTEHLAFGFGRRICVGRYFADPSVWAVIAKVLAVFKILKAVDENGMEIPVEPRFSTGLVV
ncbi:cytochrome P450 [Lanmaoa asiatica]|nr:cytochrome P450 [Lanmaoa asiatica]